MGWKGSVALAVGLGCTLFAGLMGAVYFAGERQEKSASRGDRLDTEIALHSAGVNAITDRPYDSASLSRLPFVMDVLKEQAEAGRTNVKSKLRDPTSMIWGPSWTTDYVYICGEVNGKNAFGAYTGAKQYYSVQGMVPLLEGDLAFRTDEWLTHCSGRRVAILPADSV